MEKRICVKENCENAVPKYYVDENDKRHSCQNRKFCFECSPYGSHNTRNLNNETPKKKRYNDYHKKYFYDKQKRVSKKVYDIVGYDCWKCKYDIGIKGQSVLEFHHINPEDKLFGLSTREFVGRAWHKVWKEMQKCASICCRCHREYHAGLISNEEIRKIYDDRWKLINGSVAQR